MNREKTSLDKFVESLDPTALRVLCVLISKAGGDVSFDLEDLTLIKRKSFSYACTDGTFRFRVVDEPASL